jgi:hypothetical protein
MYKQGFDAAAQASLQADQRSGDLRFREIDRDAPDRLVAQLAGNDLVHVKGAGDVEELRRFRLGGEQFDRTCFAMLDSDDRIHSAIYVLKTYDGIETDRDLHGNIATTLHSETSADRRTPNALIFYSISNLTDVSGVGQKLVQNLYAYLQAAYPGAKRSTLSPLRTFDQNFTDEQSAKFDGLSAQAQARAVLDYILSGDRGSMVQQFHLGNGARVADIKLASGDVATDRDTGTARRHLAMVNYAYDMGEAQLHENAAAFRDVKKLIRNTDMDPELRAVTIRHKLWPLVSGVILEDTGIANSLAMHGGRPSGDRPAVLGL